MKIAVVGGLTIDITLENIPIIGGPPWYAGTVSHALNSDVSIVSAVGTDYPTQFLQLLTKYGLNTSHVVKITVSNSYSFKPFFVKGARGLKLVSKGPENPLALLNDVEADAVIVSPVFKEVDEKLVKKARVKSGLLAIDIQGFVRDIDSQNNIVLTPLATYDVFRYADILHCSVEEALSLTGCNNIIDAASELAKHGARLCLIGLENGLLFLENKTLSFIEVKKPKSVKDTTGAGDILIGAFTTLVAEGCSSEEASLKALEAVSLSLERPPPRRVPEKLNLTGRASRVVWRREVV